MSAKYRKFFVPAFLASSLLVAAAPTSAAASATTGFPTGCGLSVLVGEDGKWVSGSSVSSCPNHYPVQSIQMESTLFRSRWYGWEEMNKNAATRFNVTNHAFSVRYNCSGTGVYDYKVVTKGVITLQSGQQFTAAAYDQKDKVSC